ncbi:MAG: DUF1501 domain-containing protein [Planctomycetes bacterium]|nr:DUF1501 domain-containing protein [Planctomycetota bacterium]
MNPHMENVKAMTRRHLLGRAGLGLGGIALGSMLGAERASGATAMKPHKNPMAPRPPFYAPKAKSVIYLHMAGAPSQVDLLDYKPALVKFDGKPCPDEYIKGKRFAFIKGVPSMLAPQFKFAQHGQSGQWISELLPQFASVVDETCVIRSMHTDQFNHAPAQLYVQTGNPRLGYPSMGSWVTYGLGSENENLPGFVVLLSGGKTPSGGKSLWGSGFLPSVYQGVQCRTTGEPVLYLSNPKGMDATLRRQTLDTIRRINEQQLELAGDPETLTRIAQYELAYRMQTAVPEVMDISREPAHILEMYGAKPGYVSEADTTTADPRTVHSEHDATFANNCLLARRLVENGVRFVQLYDWGWDHHANSARESIDGMLPIKAAQIDRAVAGLLRDLKQRGLLETTLVVWGAEFGRTPMMQNNTANNAARKPGFIGRDHHPYGYTVWLAGGGIKGGLAHGQTDDIGYYPATDAVEIHDLQATILHLLGLDPFQFHFPFQGLNNRLIGPSDKPEVVNAILA